MAVFTEGRGQIFYEQEKYDLSDAEYRKMIKIDPGNTMGYMGIGRNANMQERWDDAIEQFDYVVKMAPEYSSGYSFRADAYVGKKDWGKATDDIIKALDIDGDQKAFFIMQTLPNEDKVTNMMKTKLKIQKTKQPTNRFWPYALGKFLAQRDKYAEAIEYFEEAHRQDANSIFLEEIAQCYQKMKDYEKALDYADQAINMNPEDSDLLELKAEILMSLGRYDEALEERDKYVEQYPGVEISYLNRAETLMSAGKFEKAAEDYNTAAMLSPWVEEVEVFLMKRGDAYRLSGKQEDAKADYERIIELEKDSVPNGNSCIYYAYSGLGNADKAIETMKYAMENDTTDVNGNYYNLACVYARLGMKDEALQAFEKAIEAGYDNYGHAKGDYDLDPIKEMPAFQNIIKELEEKAKAQTETAKDEAADVVYETVEVPFSKDGGVTKVKCTINELPLHFVFDTGAADVTISMVEANFMMKNDYIKPSDIIGSARYMDANGDISEGTIVNLRKVNFGGLELDNVRASVVRNQVAPLLLGQSVLGRLGKIEIDNPKMKLVITHKVKK